MVDANGPSKTRIVFVVRHGERADHVDEKWKGHPDAVLTDKGAKQATETGLMIKQKIEEIEQS